MCYSSEPVLKSGDHGLTVWAGTNPLDLHIVNLHLYRLSRLDVNKKTYLDSNELLNELVKQVSEMKFPGQYDISHQDVVLSLLGKFFKGLHVSSRLVPARHLVVNDLGTVENIQ